MSQRLLLPQVANQVVLHCRLKLRRCRRICSIVGEQPEPNGSPVNRLIFVF
jgi:hypothetical protein